MSWFSKKQKQLPVPPPSEVSAEGAKRWFNEKGELHREDGPAIVWPDGTKMWFKNGKRHREDGPAVEYPSGNCGWYLNGEAVEPFAKFKKSKEKPAKKQAREDFAVCAPAVVLSTQTQQNRKTIAVFLRRNEVAFYPANADESRQIQERLFEMGFGWNAKGKKIIHTDQTGLVIIKGKLYYQGGNDQKTYESFAVKDLLEDNVSAFETKDERLERRLAALEEQMQKLIEHLMPKEDAAPIVQAKSTTPLKAKRRMPG